MADAYDRFSRDERIPGRYYTPRSQLQRDRALVENFFPETARQFESPLRFPAAENALVQITERTVTAWRRPFSDSHGRTAVDRGLSLCRRIPADGSHSLDMTDSIATAIAARVRSRAGSRLGIERSVFSATKAHVSAARFIPGGSRERTESARERRSVSKIKSRLVEPSAAGMAGRRHRSGQLSFSARSLFEFFPRACTRYVTRRAEIHGAAQRGRRTSRMLVYPLIRESRGAPGCRCFLSSWRDTRISWQITSRCCDMLVSSSADPSRLETSTSNASGRS